MHRLFLQSKDAPCGAVWPPVLMRGLLGRGDEGESQMPGLPRGRALCDEDLQVSPSCLKPGWNLWAGDALTPSSVLSRHGGSASGLLSLSLTM